MQKEARTVGNGRFWFVHKGPHSSASRRTSEGFLLSGTASDTGIESEAGCHGRADECGCSTLAQSACQLLWEVFSEAKAR